MIEMLHQNPQNAITQKLFITPHSSNNPPAEKIFFPNIDFFELDYLREMVESGSTLIGGCRNDF